MPLSATEKYQFSPRFSAEMWILGGASRPVLQRIADEILKYLFEMGFTHEHFGECVASHSRAALTDRFGQSGERLPRVRFGGIDGGLHEFSHAGACVRKQVSHQSCQTGAAFAEEGEEHFSVGIQHPFIASRDDLTVHRDIADGLLQVMACRVGELLQIRIGSPQGFFFLLLLVDIRVGADPHRDPAFRITHGKRPAQMPAILSIGPAETMFEMKCFTGLDRTPPRLYVFFYIFRMNKLGPGRSCDLLRGQTGKTRTTAGCNNRRCRWAQR